MNLEEASASRWATPRQQRRLEQNAVPVTDPLAQDYAVWRRSLLLRGLLAGLLGLILTCGGVFANHKPTSVPGADQDGQPGQPDEPQSQAEEPEPPIRVLLLTGLFVLSYAGLGLWITVLTVRSAWNWARPALSHRLAWHAWLLSLLGPLPLFLVPWARILGLDGVAALRFAFAEGPLMLMLTWTVPTVLALLPASLRAALAIKLFLPESTVPGWLALLPAPFYALAYLLLLGVVVQFTLNPSLVGGLVLLAGSALTCLIWARPLLRRDTPAGAARTVWAIVWTQRALSWTGLALLAWFVNQQMLRVLSPWLYKAALDYLLAHFNIWWLLNFVVSGIASGSPMAVLMADLIIGAMHRVRESNKQFGDTPGAIVLDQKLTSLGQTLR